VTIEAVRKGSEGISRVVERRCDVTGLQKMLLSACHLRTEIRWSDKRDPRKCMGSIDSSRNTGVMQSMMTTAALDSGSISKTTQTSY
jgi:hypothetical protein